MFFSYICTTYINHITTMTKKSIFLLMTAVAATLTSCGSSPVAENDVALQFNPDGGVSKSITLPGGQTVNYQAYEGIYYVTNVEDSTYQTLNIYVPEGADSNSPILLRTYAGGYMASTAKTPSATDATGRALAEGMVVCIPGSRGWNSFVVNDGDTIYTGRGASSILDLKAAIRYLHANDEIMPGNAERIFTNGTSAGGAMSALMGATGNSPDYEPYLQAMGAANARDDVFASICYCPMLDLDNADMGYEWLYGCTNDKVRALSPELKKVSEELAAAFPDYLNSLNLTNPKDGTPITIDNYTDYVKSFIIASAQRARNEGCDIPDDIGIINNNSELAPQSGREAPMFGPGGVMFARRPGEFIVDVDLDTYLNYVASTTKLKNPPAFDPAGIEGQNPSPENLVFGDATGSFTNYSKYSTTANGVEVSDQLAATVHMMNPMYYIEDSQSVTAPHWYIRHGARDRDGSFCTPINFATKLTNAGYDVNFALPWNRPHSGDYNLDDLFCWIHSVAE